MFTDLVSNRAQLTTWLMNEVSKELLHLCICKYGPNINENVHRKPQEISEYLCYFFRKAWIFRQQAVKSKTMTKCNCPSIQYLSFYLTSLFLVTPFFSQESVLTLRQKVLCTYKNDNTFCLFHWDNCSNIFQKGFSTPQDRKS